MSVLQDERVFGFTSKSDYYLKESANEHIANRFVPQDKIRTPRTLYIIMDETDLRNLCIGKFRCVDTRFEIDIAPDISGSFWMAEADRARLEELLSKYPGNYTLKEATYFHLMGRCKA